MRVKGDDVRRLGILAKRAPSEVWVEGVWDEAVFKNSVAVVGSRRMTEYGRRVLERLIPKLVGEGRTVVSGFMYGVDMTAHEMTMALGGKTVAVLGWGIESTPPELRVMAKRMVDSGGMVISEWREQKATRWTFPLRNRIVVALVDEVVVVEAAGKSGALITANLAIKYGKPVWAVPGPVTSRVSEGTNELIASGKAKIWTEAKSPPVVSQNQVIKLIENEEMDASEIARRLGKTVADVGAELTMLVLSGQVVESNGRFRLG